MKEEELDKFVGKLVEVTDFEGEKFTGKFYKIVDSKTSRNRWEVTLHNIVNGYSLQGTRIGNIDFRKSHIKKIRTL